jgi:RNA polymerase sigma-70 factor (sigma-E family)
MDGDEARAAFDLLVQTRYGELRRSAYRLTGNWATAEDLVQTSLAKTWSKWETLRDRQAGEAYARKVMATTSISWWRKRSSSEVPTAEFREGAGSDPTDAVGEIDEMQRALARLPRRMRAVLVLRFAEDRSEAEVAEMLGISVGTVKSTTSRALARLRVDDELCGPGFAPRAQEGLL